MKWCTVAPIHNYWHPDPALSGAIKFDEMLSLRPIPKWVRNEALLEHLSWADRDRIIRSTGFVRIATYEASTDGEPDPEWDGVVPRSKQEKALQAIIRANLGMWLASPSCAGFRVALDLSKSASSWQLRGSATFPRIIPHDNYATLTFPRSAFRASRRFYRALSDLPRGSHLWISVRSLWRALREELWEVRFPLLWVVMESLFGSENSQEITYRLSQRAARFLEPKAADARALFPKIKAGYGWRSKVVHGMQPAQMKKLTAEQSLQLSFEVESLVHRALNKILSAPEHTQKFGSSSERERFLDDLVLS